MLALMKQENATLKMDNKSLLYRLEDLELQMQATQVCLYAGRPLRYVCTIGYPRLRCDDWNGLVIDE